MGFSELEIKSEYRSKAQKVSEEFYYPVLKNAVCYDRAVGFFSSTVLIDIAKGLKCFVDNGGKIRLIASPKLSEEDIEAIRNGYKAREEVFKEAAIRELYEPQNFTEQNRLALLSKLIQDQRLDIKLAIIEDYGIYHEKIGLFTSDINEKIAFTGSMNETYMAMNANYESIDVYCSWKNEYELERVNNKNLAFERLWNNVDENVNVMDFVEVKDEIIARYQKADFSYDTYREEEEKEVEEKELLKKEHPEIPDSIKLYDYQWDAINQWAERDYRGIFDMATGTGKTYTGIAALCKLFEEKKRLVAVIVCPQTHLVEQWIEDLKCFHIRPIVAYGISKYRDYPMKVRKALLDYKLKTKDFVCIICTKDTFIKEKLQTQLNKCNSDMLLLVDEVHNMGARSYLGKMTDIYNYRLGLSATIERHHDSEGTDALYAYFGEKCITYTLERAIKEKKLTPYDYYPVLVTLTPDELYEYNRISAEIAKNIVLDKKGNMKLNEKGKMLAIQRSRVVAGAELKVEALMDRIKEYVNDRHILIYCGATSIHDTDSEDDETTIRQIDKITQKLGLELGMKTAQFTSRENQQQRKLLKEEFENGDNLQALVAIKCLDEGVNIPAIKTAFILASTTNPKEYIQRRGRVLRLHEGKKKAVIYDFVTLPHDIDLVPSLSLEEMLYDKSLVKNELKRMEEFQRIADNPYDSMDIIRKIKDVYQLYEEDNENGEFEAVE